MYVKLSIEMFNNCLCNFLKPGYVIEKRISTSTKFNKVVTLDANCLTYCIDNLKDKSEFTFKVYAENAIGLSPPALADKIILKTHASEFLKKC